MSNFDSNNTLTMAVTRDRIPPSKAHKGTWFRSTWFRTSFGVMGGLTLATAIVSESSLEYLAGQLVLILSVFLSLYILSDKPLINPIQVVVGLFYWWFGIGPVLTSTFYLLVGDPDKAALVHEAGRESLWIVSLGLPFYAVAARKTLHLLDAKKVFSRFLMPRALMREKPNSDIGNFFARTVGVDIGISTPENYDVAIALSIPFEFVGNFGFLAGILSFPLIGLFWALICGWLFSASRISNHPFSPLLCFVVITMESPFGSFLAVLRGYLIPLIVMAFIWILRKRQL